jgi:hypothetical protein
MTQGTWRRELAWAIGLPGLAVIRGLSCHWPLVQASWRGNLTARLDQKRQEQREVRKAEEYQELHMQGAVNVAPETYSVCHKFLRLGGS